ncbi:hypothetical protein BurJ1DRAFT_1248 [Burkholderiales bacterium JOSHI_001]|nr:hypothetical protein BurJ1DRAFT_1248 [Burkholderiales bacterium JOSHI_001]
MPAPETIDSYFTRSIVGSALTVEMGPGDTARNQPEHGTWLEATRNGAELVSLAGRSLLGADPESAPINQPVSPQRLSRVRRHVALALLLAWSGLLWLVFTALNR